MTSILKEESRNSPAMKCKEMLWPRCKLLVSLACGINIYLMRLADVYLMYAEACLRSQDETTAKEYINKVRRRAYDKPITLPSDIDIASSGDALWNDLREERFKEFCGEGVQHWCDVCRWKTLKDELEKWYPKTLAGPTVYDDFGFFLCFLLGGCLLFLFHAVDV